MPAKATGDTPPKVILNLDTMEAEARPDPFVIQLKGKQFTFADPKSVDYRDVNRADRSGDLEVWMETYLTPTALKAFNNLNVSTGNVSAIYEAWHRHYGLIKDEGNGNASDS